MQTQIIVGSTTYGSDKIFESTYTHTVNSGQQLNIGTVASAQVTFKTDLVFSVGTSFTYKVRPHNTGAFTQLGVFTIKSVGVAVKEAINKKLYTYTAYDNVSKLDRVVDSWYSGRSYPINFQSLFTTLCSACGVTGNGSFQGNAAQLLAKPFDVTNLNGKTVAGWIAQLAGGFVCADSTGTLYIKNYSNTSSKSFTYNDYTRKDIANFKVLRPSLLRVVKNTKGEFRDFGSGSPMIKITGNPLLYENQNSIQYCGNTLGFLPAEYTPMTIHLLDDITVKAGDKITVDGVATIVMTVKIDKSGITLSSTGVETRQEETELQNDFVSYDYLEQNKIKVDTTNYGFVVDNGTEKTRLTPTQLIHEGSGMRSAAVQGDGFRWFDSTGYLKAAFGQNPNGGEKGFFGFDTSGNLTYCANTAATDNWYRVIDTNNVEASNATSSGGTWRTMSNPPSTYWRAIKGFILELTNQDGTYIYASTPFLAWPYGSSTIEKSTTSAVQDVTARATINGSLVTASCSFRFSDFKYTLIVSNNIYYARLRCFF